MTTTTEPAARKLLPRFAQQFTHPRHGRPVRQTMLVLHPDLLQNDREWLIIEGAVEFLADRIDDPHLFVVIIDNRAFEEFMHILQNQLTYTYEDVADVPGDNESGFVGVPFEVDVEMDSLIAARLVLRLEPYWLHEEDNLFWWKGNDFETNTGGQFPFFILPEDWEYRRDELAAMVNIDGIPVYPQQIWDPEGHGYISHTYDSRGDYTILPFG